MARGEFWSRDEERVLREHYPAGGTKRVARILLHRTLSAIKARANYLHVRLHNNQKASDARLKAS